MVARGRSIVLDEGRKHREFEGDIFEELKTGAQRPTRQHASPDCRLFTAGAVGFFSYDVVRLIEKLPATAKDELGVPRCLPDVLRPGYSPSDHVKKEIHLILTADLTRQDRKGAYERAVKRLDKLERRLADALPRQKRRAVAGKLKLIPRTSKAAFLKAVNRTKEYISSGDVFQCVLSQRFDCTRALTSL